VPQKLLPCTSLVTYCHLVLRFMPSVREANLEFAFSLYRAVAQQEKGNIVISPVSFSLAFSLLANGADSASRQEIFKLTRTDGLEINALNDENLKLQRALNQPGTDTRETFISANSLWASLPMSFSPAFLEAGQRYYEAEVASVGRSELPSRVSVWAREKTRDLVDMQLQETDFALLSATYFKGRWASPFPEAATRPENFHAPNESPQQVPMMNRQGEFLYSETQDFQLLALPYFRATMYLLLPHSSWFHKGSIRDLEQEVLSGDVRNTMESMEERPGRIKVPKFKFRYDGDFIPVLKGMGLNRVFASFDSLRPAVTHPDGARITRVLQNNFLSVDEYGSEAASVLAIAMRAGAAPPSKPPKPFEFIADRPFCFWIIDNATFSVLFVGRVSNPLG
jgi:serine protease inhibitor